MEIDLNAPAFANPTVSTEIAPAVAPQAEGEEEGKGTSAPEPVVEEQQVPYSRFSTALRRAKDAERETEYYRQKAQERAESPRSAPVEDIGVIQPYQGGLPGYWVKLYGDSPASREGYSYELERQRRIEASAEARALQVFEQYQTREQTSLIQNEGEIDDRLLDLSSQLGRELNPDEESAILDIIDEYTPTGPDGKYAGDLISFEKAWSIYEMQQANEAQSSRQSRRRATSAAASRSEGEPTSGNNNDTDFNPRDWSAWKKKYAGS